MFKKIDSSFYIFDATAYQFMFVLRSLNIYHHHNIQFLKNEKPHLRLTAGAVGKLNIAYFGGVCNCSSTWSMLKLAAF